MYVIVKAYINNIRTNRYIIHKNNRYCINPTANITFNKNDINIVIIALLQALSNYLYKFHNPRSLLIFFTENI